ncbi:phosphatase PAP2 family protein [Chromobacterium phragmitis]|uniref:Phosphatase PAP2 family protein n=1 Tax=Chromobacterium phragmitis TaxID=2202141 RepID=A0ABV0IYT2_9NEIS
MAWLRRFWPAVLLAALGAALIAWPQANRQLFVFLHPLLHHLPAPWWRFFSVFGDWPTVLALMLALCWREPRRLPALIVGGAAAIALAVLLKAGFAVPRPPLVLPHGVVDLLDRLPGNGSFPSGHAMASAALATFAWRGIGWGKAGAWLPLVGLVMLSRIAIGVHWPLDLAAGSLLGWGTMRLALAWAWPDGWPRDVTRTAELILLVGLAGSLAWLLGRNGLFAEYWLRVAIASAVLATGFWRVARSGR